MYLIKPTISQGEGSSIELVDDLNQTESGKALDARQGNLLKGMIPSMPDLREYLKSTDLETIAEKISGRVIPPVVITCGNNYTTLSKSSHNYFYHIGVTVTEIKQVGIKIAIPHYYALCIFNPTSNAKEGISLVFFTPDKYYNWFYINPNSVGQLGDFYIITLGAEEL